MTGIQRISTAFTVARAEKRAALMPYFTLGYPDPSVSLEILEAIARSGADLIELGVPFSDPLADGPTIQRSTQQALERGMNVARCLEMVSALREMGILQPLLLMGYINPILAYGIERFVGEAANAGADGLIVPDLPPEEAAQLEQACRAGGLALVYLLPPTASLDRVKAVSARSTGFVYLVSLTGVTGARQALPPDLENFIRRVRQVTDLPLAVGFGISNPEQARAVGTLADGVIVGSALIDAIDRVDNPVQAAGEFVFALSRALQI
jgi:tryptophan synthase alpha chain